MKTVRRALQFFRLTDETNSLDLLNVAFIIVMAKIVKEPGIDYASVCSIVPVLAAKMHRRHLRISQQPDAKDQRTQRSPRFRA